MFLKFDPYRVWCSIFYSKLVNCILLKITVQHIRFVKDTGTCNSGERNVKIWIDFRKSPSFSLTSPLSQEREKSSRPVFTMCGEPCNPQIISAHKTYVILVISQKHFIYRNDSNIVQENCTNLSKSIKKKSLIFMLYSV